MRSIRKVRDGRSRAEKEEKNTKQSRKSKEHKERLGQKGKIRAAISFPFLITIILGAPLLSPLFPSQRSAKIPLSLSPFPIFLSECENLIATNHLLFSLTRGYKDEAGRDQVTESSEILERKGRKYEEL